jgi:uncharacterized membrane protein HdeD (DUF308 family)
LRIVLSDLGGLLALAGVTWILQGLNILPGSFMTGQLQWAAYGTVALLVGVRVLVAAYKMRKR